jgi:hypothetical protein
VPVHVFVDESDRGTYLVCAAVVAPAGLGELRQLLRGFCLPGQRRLHFKSENNARRKQILDALAAAGVQARIYRCRDISTVRARRHCLNAMVHDLVGLDAQRLVIESQQGQDERDKQVIFHALRSHRATADRLRYGHMRPYEEPGLWAADAIAWAHGAGGRWRAQTGAIVTAVVDVET